MSPQWIPQNIQKRLLLYVLHQLSLFSEIDLPNLEEVSFNNILLRDILIDSEKVGKLPGCSLRYGKIGTLILNGGVMGGVNIDANDVELVIAPDFDINEDIKNSLNIQIAQSTADLANSIIVDQEDNIGSPEKGIKRTSLHSSLSSEASNSSKNSAKPSALSGVMAKAVDMALLRLLITLSNIKVKLVSELTDLSFEIDKISISTINGSRKISIQGVKLICLKPDINPGEFGDNDTEESNLNASTDQVVKENVNDNDENKKNEDDSMNDNDNESKDSDDDYVDQSLMDSMVFTHEEASSIYMSAIDESTSGPKVQEANKKTPVLFSVDFIDVSFDGLSTISNLEIDVGNINISLTPLLPTVIVLLNGISKSIKLQAYQMRKKNINRNNSRNPKFPQYEDDDIVNDVVDEDMSDSPVQSDDVFLKKFHIQKILLSLTSGLNMDGSFGSSRNHLFFDINNIYIKQKNEELVYGGLESLSIIRTVDGIRQTVFYFDEKSPEDQKDSATKNESQAEKGTLKADIRFELRSTSKYLAKVSNITTLLSKPAKLSLDISSLLKLTDFFTNIVEITSTYKALRASLETLSSKQIIKSSKTAETNNNSFLLQTSSVRVSLLVSQRLKLIAIIFPLSYNLIKDDLDTVKVLFKTSINNIETTVGTIRELNLHLNIKEFPSFIDQNSTSNNNGRNSLPRKLLLSSNLHLIIKKIDVSIEFETFIFLINEISDFFKEFSRVQEYDSYNNRSVGDKKFELNTAMHSSIYSKRPNRRLGNSYNKIPLLNASRSSNVSFRMMVNELEMDILKFVPGFEDIKIKLNEFLFHEYRGEFHGSILYFDIRRVLNGIGHETMVSDFRREGPDIKSPLILIIYKKTDKGNTIDFILRNIMFEYYTSWLNILEDNFNTKTDSQEHIPRAIKEKSIEDGESLDIRFVFYDNCVGLTPGRLKSKGILVINKGTSDITFGKDQFYIKSSFRKSCLLLIDDLKNVVPPTTTKETNLINTVSPTSFFLSSGYISVLSVNSTHVGLTINTDIDSILRRNKEMKIKSDTAHFDIKLNSDQHQIELCADSMVTLIQLINDLKLPLNFQDKDRMKIKLNEGLDLTTLTKDNCFSHENLNGEDSKSDSNDVNLLNIVDEYYYNKNISKEFDLGLKDLSISKDNDDESCNSQMDSLKFEEDHFTSQFHTNTVGKVFPVSININLSKVSIFLYDGYEWKHTRKCIKNAFKKMEGEISKEMDKADDLSNSQPKDPLLNSGETPDDDNGVITETVFKSIHISLPKGIDPSKAAKNINRKVQGNSDEKSISEKGKNYRKLKLRRSNNHRILVELSNTEINALILSTRDPRRDYTDPSLDYEIVNTLDLRVDDLEIYDNLPSSTWNKFLTYMTSSGDREVGKSMLKLSVINTRPDPNLVAADSSVNISVLPIRLYMDQETLDFIVRFMEFKDERFHLPPDEIIFIQKFDIDPINLKIDYKPKNIDFAGIRSGNASELMNLFTLDSSEIKLAKVKIYGILGFPKLGEELARLWLPHIQKTQLGGILSGVSPIRSLVNIGSGFKDLVFIPVEEYRKDKRLVRSIKKGTSVFAKTTVSELLKFGVKIASGTQVLLEQGEEMLGGEGAAIRNQNKDSLKNYTSRDKNDLSTAVTEEKDNLKKSNNDYLASSILLTGNDPVKGGHYNNNQLYSYIELDDSNEIDNNLLDKKLLLLREDDELSYDEEFQNFSDSDIDFDLEDMDEEKLVSLYSNQPESIQEGLKLAYKSMNKNLGVTKRKILNLKNEINETDNFQESLVSVIKSGPVIIIRPLIGTTEAISKTLMGIGNGIDAKYLKESRDKYRSNNEE